MIAGLPDLAVERAQRLAATVHGDGDAAAVAGLLTPLATDDLYAVAVALAAMVDIDQTARQLLAWAEGEERKHCPACQQTLPVSSYASDRTRRDGLAHYCRICHAAKARARAVRKRCDELGIRTTSPTRQVASVTQLPRRPRRHLEGISA